MDLHRDYNQDRELAKQFLRDFTYADEQGEVLNKYGPLLTQMANRDLRHMFIELADVEQFNQDLAAQIMGNTKRYVSIFYEAVDELLPSYKTREPAVKDPLDIFVDQRLHVVERNQRNNQGSNPVANSQQGNDPARMTTIDIDGKYPPDLIRRYEIYFKPTSLQSTPVREVKAEQIGKFVTIRGIVTRITDVKPRITIVTYTCDQCGCETFQPVDGLEYTPLFECSSAVCKANKALGRVTPHTRGSKFVKYQEIKLQENSDQVPTGHIPRTITIHSYGELTRLCAPGDHVSVSGVFLTLDKSGFFRMRNGGLSSDVYIEAHNIIQINKTEDDELNEDCMTMEEAELLYRDNDNFLQKLTNSIAPEIYGHTKLKQALLLLLVGGVDRNPHGMKIRGNINICIMGDPGVAKSQLLSFINRLASRCNYTTGRGSSGVGLTAAVLKDPITNELVLEGGALVLADKGICCIDEFDKMMEADRTAIHEVMEQQTVSIAKAGIMTTLNARVSILAAANPAWGRYNIHRSITDNLQLPPALLSRFDLLWLIRDTPDQARDLDLAEHITHVHANPNAQLTDGHTALDMKVMRRYINLCKTKNPKVPESLTDRLVKVYLGIRVLKRINPHEDSLFTSPRSLLAVIRLSTAFARLRLADEVTDDDVKAAVDLFNASRESIGEGNKNTDHSKEDILKILRQVSYNKQSADVNVALVCRYAREAKYTEQQVEDTLTFLQGIQTIDRDGDIITLVYGVPDKDPAYE